jgi:hypothetical protein
MTAKRVYYLMIAIVVLLVGGIIGGAYGIQVLLKGESAELASLKAKVGALNQETISLKKAKKDITTYTELYNISKVVVPENKNQAQAVRQIVKLADENGIVLDSITFPASTLGSTPLGTKPGVTSPTGPSATTGTASLSQLVPVPTIPGVYDLQLTVASSPSRLATYSQLINFLSALEQNRQTALVSSINIQPDSNNHRLFSFNLTLDIYIKP